MITYYDRSTFRIGAIEGINLSVSELSERSYGHYYPRGMKEQQLDGMGWAIAVCQEDQEEHSGLMENPS